MNYIIKYILASSSKDNKILFFNIKQYIIYCNACRRVAYILVILFDFSFIPL